MVNIIIIKLTIEYKLSISFVSGRNSFRLGKIFAKNCMKIKERIGPREEGFDPKQDNSGADPGFPVVGSANRPGGANTRNCQIFRKTA